MSNGRSSWIVVFLMLKFVQGNLLQAETDALVNAVNTVGVMGKGIALQFKEAYPDNFREYVAACKAGEVQVGRVFTTRTSSFSKPKWIVNFPTKQHWRQPTKLEWVIEGLGDLRAFIEREKVQSIAIPALGCGNGGLNWGRVRPEIEAALQELDDVDVQIFEPAADA